MKPLWYDCGNGVSLALYEKATSEDFALYCTKLNQQGYVQTDSFEIDRNLHLTFQKGGMKRFVSYSPNEKKLRDIEDGFSAEPEQKSDFPLRTKSKLWQIETDHSLIDCGMCYVLQAKDGSFFIIDSGHFLQLNDHKRLYRFLRQRTPANEKIVIAGWLFTHGHDDHVCKFMDFLNEKHDDVIIEKLYGNLIPPDHRDSVFWGQGTRDTAEKYQKTVLQSGIPYVKLHTGQHFYIRNFEITVLCTHEDVFPLCCRDYNDSSLVTTIETDGCKIFFPGDAATQADKVLLARYTQRTLHCNIMQQAHHGHTGLSSNFYRIADAQTILFPTTQIKFDEEYIDKQANRVSCDIAKECFIASNGTVELPLPYRVGTAKLYPDETFENFAAINTLWHYEYTPQRKRQLFEKFLERAGLPPLSEIKP